MATATADIALSGENAPAHHGPRETHPKLMLGAVGVVYGDIGTSPLYTMKESFLGPHPLAVDVRQGQHVMSASGGRVTTSAMRCR